MQNHTITLNITSETDPHTWDWPELLDLPDRDDVEVVDDPRKALPYAVVDTESEKLLARFHDIYSAEMFIGLCLAAYDKDGVEAGVYGVDGPNEDIPTGKVRELIEQAHRFGLLRHASDELDFDQDRLQLELRRTFGSGVEFGYNPVTDSIEYVWQSVDGVDLEPEEFLAELEYAIEVATEREAQR